MAEYYGPPEADERSELMMDFGGTGFLVELPVLKCCQTVELDSSKCS